MVLYLLNEWEQNGYHDSYFYASYYDSEKNEIHATQYGTTACAAPTTIGIGKNGVSSVSVNGESLVLPTLEAIESARKVLAQFYFDNATARDKRIVDEPDVADLFVGLSLVTTSEIKNQVKIKEDCRKCNGSGKWVNPRNSADKRDCFTCKGTGKFSIGTSKNEAGKIQYNKITAGTEGTVVEWRSFGKFYANGYNKPDRSNTTVTLKRADGSLFNASLGKCKCARDYTLPSVLREKANEASYRYSFQDATGVRCAWLSTDYVYQVLAANKEKVA